MSNDHFRNVRKGMNDHFREVGNMIRDTPISDTPISDSTPHNVGDLGMLCRRLERELNAANSIIRQQQLLDEENLRQQDRIKRLEEALDKTTKIAARHIQQLENGGDEAIYKTNLFDRELHWNKAKEAKL